MANNLNKTDRLEISMDNLRDLIVEAVKSGRRAEKKDQSNNKNPKYKDTERLLYSYPSLIRAIQEDENSIKIGTYESYQCNTGKSKDIIKFSKSSGSKTDPCFESERLAAIERTKRQIERIERAMKAISVLENYQIIEMKYFGTKADRYWDGNTLDILEIAETMHLSDSTVRRRRSELINRLSIMIFGADAINL